MLDRNDTRLQELQQWVYNQLEDPQLQISLLAADASFRRYFRVQLNGASWVAMDAPPERENIRPFIAIAQTFLKQGVNVPQIFHQNINQGFLLLSDLGNDLYINELNPDNAENLYHNAFEPLLRIQHCRQFTDWKLPLFNAELITLELQRFQDWFLQQHLQLTLTQENLSMLNKLYQQIITRVTEQPQCCVHRDYHAGNLMRLPNNQVGVLDFQDAVIGPVTYDIVFLLRDCRIDFDPQKVDKWTLDFYHLQSSPKFSFAQFSYWFDWMGLQTHLKVLGIFARLAIRDHKPRYLQHIPRIINYILPVCDRYPELAPLKLFFNNHIMPKVTVS